MEYLPLFHNLKGRTVLIVGGGIANTFLAAAGYKVGKSLHEADLIDTAKAIAAKVAVPLPVDVVVAKEFAESAEATVKAIADVADDDMILDIGPKTAAMFGEMLKASQTILWNGPVGVFEFDQFGNGTKVLAQAIAESPAFSIAGGGDTLAAIDKYGVGEQISYISTGGGAFLEFLEGNSFVVTESKNSKLLPGDRIRINHLILHYPLIIVNVCRDNKDLGRFTAGKISGITSIQFK